MHLERQTRAGAHPAIDERRFGPLELLKEYRIPPAARVPLHPRYDAEIVAYVLEGVLANHDATDRSGLIHAGEFQRASSAQGSCLV
jgi:quercetin 2,3-dioxygenase